MNTESKELSRRCFCKCSMIGSLGAVVFLAKPAMAKGKMTQKKVSYQDTPKGNQQCDGCKLFQPPNACKAVEGEISPKGWCTLFQPKDT